MEKSTLAPKGRFLPKAILTIKVVFMALCLGACNPKFEDPTQKQDERVSSLKLAQAIQTKIEALPEPEKYKVSLFWPQLLDSKSIRFNFNQSKSVVKPSENTFSFLAYQGQVISIVVEILNDSGAIEKTFTKVINVPIDYVVRGTGVSLKENTTLNVNRIFILNSKLLTNGFSFKAVANEFIVDKGLIETISENQKAPLNTPGKSGGEINIEAKKAIGELKVILRGENGGDGTNATAYTTRAKDGIPAQAGEAECGCPKCPKPNLSRPIETLIYCSCITPGINGTPGMDGLQGKQGLPAQPGGDSGKLTIKVESGNGFKVDPEFKPGIAGIPGKGGPGQDGGFGSESIPGKCGALGAKAGSKGSIGSDGLRAEDGKIIPSCIKIASEAINECAE